MGDYRGQIIWGLVNLWELFFFNSKLGMKSLEGSEQRNDLFNLRCNHIILVTVLIECKRVMEEAERTIRGLIVIMTKVRAYICLD